MLRLVHVENLPTVIDQSWVWHVAIFLGKRIRNQLSLRTGITESDGLQKKNLRKIILTRDGERGAFMLKSHI